MANVVGWVVSSQIGGDGRKLLRICLAILHSLGKGMRLVHYKYMHEDYYEDSTFK
jgi:hypothetical protein